MANSHNMLLNKRFALPVICLTMTGSMVVDSMAQTPAVDQKVSQKAHSLEDVIARRVAAMPRPKVRPNLVQDEVIMTSSSKLARNHVQQGFSLIYAQWDFEAYRHFSAALQADPECLMAYAGVALSNARPHGEYSAYRVAAVARILDLVEVDDAVTKAGGVATFSHVEKQFAVAIAHLVASGPSVARGMFRQIAAENPSYSIAVVTSLFLSRGAYDANGFATPAQKEVLSQTRALLESQPDSPLVKGFLLSLMVSAPIERTDFTIDVLPSAHSLTENFPDMAPWHHAAGHFLYLTGDYEAAESAFRQAAESYSTYMQEDGVSHSDCEGYIKSMCYLADTLYQSGDFSAAMEVAQQIRSLKVDSKRLTATGSQTLLWRGHTLPAQLYIARGNKGDMELAHRSLPDKDELKPYFRSQKTPSFIGLYIESISLYIGARKAIEAGSQDGAKSLHRVSLAQKLQDMTKALAPVKNTAEYNSYYEAMVSMTVYNLELTGLIAMSGKAADQISAPGWFSSAASRQGYTSLMMPASVMIPMEQRTAEYYMLKKDFQKAQESYQDALRKRPNNNTSQMGFQKALDGIGR